MVRVTKNFFKKILLEYFPDTLVTNFIVIQCIYFLKHRRFVNVFPPKTFNAWLCRENLFRKKFEKIAISDKEWVKYYVAEKIGVDHVVPTIFCSANLEELDVNQLPLRFVIKPTHASGYVWVVTRSDFDMLLYLKKGSAWLKVNYFWAGREWNYKYLTPKIIIEPFLSEDGISWPIDYKFFVFNGKARLIQVDLDRNTEHSRVFFDTKWQALPFSLEYPLPSKDRVKLIPKPRILSEVILAVEKLAHQFKFLRVDVYIIGDRFFVGELTNTPGNGGEVFTPSEWDKRLYSWL